MALSISSGKRAAPPQISDVPALSAIPDRQEGQDHLPVLTPTAHTILNRFAETMHRPWWWTVLGNRP
jgi:hypothetical protein